MIGAWATYEFRNVHRPLHQRAQRLEIQQNLQLDGSTERPRRRELEKAGLIERNGNKRGGSAVWVLTDLGKQAAGR
ncbi:hypothetical protein [Geodermatophilus obscurus]|uniref:Uncharacterized protein n=1 Tax=Geodermatophilus obscurus (strain ATCC 25078 / DSM 43160 / JCM 3152 / CCUG 61914 / KCC A-0152 / KCTC 9177 / NBRC 13315 / NRRL B-3577 / G-20) TaxID=526225 RepID=D2S883_GEOOG|nr:hypothetical protein [Geodermatophilus obscurus]ADB73505.1 hypothetical protein Gobs_0735 [Geodermatophilus obscurus DSM 43160]